MAYITLWKHISSFLCQLMILSEGEKKTLEEEKTWMQICQQKIQPAIDSQLLSFTKPVSFWRSIHQTHGASWRSEIGRNSSLMAAIDIKEKLEPLHWQVMPLMIDFKLKTVIGNTYIWLQIKGTTWNIKGNTSFIAASYRFSSSLHRDGLSKVEDDYKPI